MHDGTHASQRARAASEVTIHSAAEEAIMVNGGGGGGGRSDREDDGGRGVLKGEEGGHSGHPGDRLPFPFKVSRTFVRSH